MLNFELSIGAKILLPTNPRKLQEKILGRSSNGLSEKIMRRGMEHE